MTDSSPGDLQRLGVERPQAGPPMITAPPVVIGVIAVMAAIHFGLLLLPDAMAGRIEVFAALSPLRLSMGAGGPGGALGWVAPIFTHIFLHGGLLHLALNSVWLLAFGTPVARRLGALGHRPGAGSPWRSLLFLAFFLASGAAGALAYVALHPAEPTFLIGASGAVSGLLGGLVRFAFRKLPEVIDDAAGFSPLGERPVLIWSALIVGINVLFGVVAPAAGMGPDNIAWEAHIGGYAFGLIFFPALARAARPSA